MDYRQSYLRLVAAVQAYDQALRRWGVLGEAWAGPSDELDELWAAVLTAAGLSAE